MSASMVAVSYVAAIILFILSLGGLSNPESSRRGNLYGMTGMAIAVLATVFVLACFVGYMVVWNVTPALHTPLMSVTNAISGIIVVGGLLSGIGTLSTPVWVALIATFFATINIAGGFLVTRRMLAMFRK